MRHSMAESHDSDDLALARLVEEATSRLQVGEELDLTDIQQRHPGHFAAFRELLPSLEILAKLGEASVSTLARTPGLGVIGDFRIIQEIARGGMGVVYEAEQVSLNRTVALKVLPFASVMDDKQLARFQHESQAAASLEHPNIVTVYAVGNDRGVHFYAMRYVAGRSLAEVIADLRHPQSHTIRTRPPVNDGDETQSAGGTTVNEQKSFSPELSNGSTDRREFFKAVARLGKQAADALHYAHESGVVHRDVKPSNLLVDARQHLWVTDFGLATTQATANLTMTGDLLGTLKYMSPEQASGRRAAIDHRTDIYSLGATLYELATLRPPFTDVERGSLLRRIIEEDPRSLRQLNRRVPQDLETIVLKAMSKEPSDRYDTMGEMADDLERFLQHKPIRARRHTRTKKLLQWARRNPRSAILLSLTTLLLLVLGIGGPIAAIQQSTLREQLEQQYYDSQVTVAQHAFEQADYDRTIDLLSPYKSPGTLDEDMRGFEWYYLWNNSHYLRNEPLRRHWVPIMETAISPDDQYVVCAMWDGKMALHDLVTRRQIWCTNPGKDNREHGTLLMAAVFSPDGRLIAGGSVDGKLILRDAASGDIVHQSILPNAIRSLAIGTSGRMLVVGMAQRVSNADALNAAVPLIHVYELGKDTNGEVRPDQLSIRKQLEGKGVAICALSPNEELLATVFRIGSEKGCRIVVWDTREWSILMEWTTTNEIVEELAFVPGRPTMLLGVAGAIQAEGQGGTIRVWDIKDQKTTHVIPGHAGTVNSIDVSGDGDLFVTGSEDRCVRLWRTNGLQLVKTIRAHHNEVIDVGISSDGRLVVSSSKDNTVKLWRIDVRRRPELVSVHEIGINEVAFSRNGKYIATAGSDGRITKRDSESLDPVWEQRLSVPGVWAIDFSPDGKRLVAGGGYFASGKKGVGELSIYDGETGDQLHVLESEDRCDYWHARYSPLGKHVAAATSTGVRVFDVQSGERLWNDDVSDVRRLSWAPNGMFLVAVNMHGAKHQVARAYMPRNGDVIWTRPAEANQLAVAVSPDSRRVAVPGDAHAIRILDAETGELIDSISRHENLIFYLDWSPDDNGKRLVSTGNDHTIRLWNTETGSELLRFHTASWGLAARFSPDGKSILTGEESRRWRIQAPIRMFRSRPDTMGEIQGK